VDVILPTGFPNLVSLQIPVQAGSRNEVEPGKSGFAHFFEHMMFRGKPRFAPEAYEALITRAGARQNAYTTDDYTNYHITFAREDLDTMLEIEADRFMHLAYAEPEFRTEARAILGEYNKSASNPLTKLFEVQREHAFAVHPYRHTTMGFIQDIEAMPEQFAYSRAFFARWYRPEYTTVIVAGDVDPRETLALAEKHWGAWRGAQQAAPPAIPQEPEPHRPVTAHVPWPAPTLPWVTVAFHGPAFSESEPGWAALDTLLDLQFGETSELYYRLVEEEQIVDRLAPHLPSTQDPELAGVLARLKRPDGVLLMPRKQPPYGARAHRPKRTQGRRVFAINLPTMLLLPRSTFHRLRVHHPLCPGDVPNWVRDRRQVENARAPAGCAGTTSPKRTSASR